MRPEKIANRILYTLRKNHNKPMSIPELQTAALGYAPRRDGHIPFDLIYQMAADDLVTIFRDTGSGRHTLVGGDAASLKKQVLSPPPASRRMAALFGIPEIRVTEARRFEMLEASHFVVLSDHFQAIHKLLGLSTRQLAEREDHSLSVNPVFGAAGTQRHDVFVMMPFAKDIRPTYDACIVPACKALGLTVGRADDLFGASHVIDDIWSLIVNSGDLIADCTGKNPNVFYELGIAHAIGKRVLLLAQSDSDIPFDLRHWRYAVYAPTQTGYGDLSGLIGSYLEDHR